MPPPPPAGATYCSARYLEGKTQDEAAAQLGLAMSTLKVRLGARLVAVAGSAVRRGLGPVAVWAVTAWPFAASSACVPAALLSKTIEAADLFAAGRGDAADLRQSRRCGGRSAQNHAPVETQGRNRDGSDGGPHLLRCRRTGSHDTGGTAGEALAQGGFLPTLKPRRPSQSKARSVARKVVCR